MKVSDIRKVYLCRRGEIHLGRWRHELYLIEEALCRTGERDIADPELHEAFCDLLIALRKCQEMTGFRRTEIEQQHGKQERR